jgi:hypothetical protein
MNQRLATIRRLAKALHEIDKGLRAENICPVCGKPKNGIVPRGMTLEGAGLCTCARPTLVIPPEPPADVKPAQDPPDPVYLDPEDPYPLEPETVEG